MVIGDPANPLGIIRVVELHGDKVRLSFDFPREVQINRKELADQKAQGTANETDGQSPKSGKADDTAGNDKTSS